MNQGGGQGPVRLSEAALSLARKELAQGQEALDDSVLHGRIVTAMPLPVAAQKRIAKRFEELLGVHVRLTCRVDHKQLAGIRVELNGYSYDGTLRGQLASVHKALTHPNEGEVDSPSDPTI